MNASCIELFIQVNQHIGCSSIHVGDRLCSHENPEWLGFCVSYELADKVAEQVGICKDEWGIPADHQ